jgi:RimJ/RimL family protein N-acetyltransferase/prolyl-tRNA editing enzyme YbaK/EbsC (Cys-tRNA(Pro) deacylase)
VSETPTSLPRSSRRVADALARRGHTAEIRVLSASARSAAEAAAALGVEQRQIVKSLVFRGARSGEPVLALVGGTSRVDAARLEAHLGEPVERAQAQWVRERTGFAIGGVPPLGHDEPLRTVADSQLASLDELWAAAGTPHAVFPLRGSELEALIGAELAAIAEPEMTTTTQATTPPIGSAIDWSPVARPPRTPMQGKHVLLRPVDPDTDAGPLYAVSHAPNGDPAIWTYLSDGPFASPQTLRDALLEWQRMDDPLSFTIVGGHGQGPLGMASFMRIDPDSGVIEIGRIWFGPPLQRTTAATEAIYLLAQRAFDELGYRRLEWKCDALNVASCRAALRFGFTFEGVFRKHMVYKGRSRDTAWFAITDDEWPLISRGFRSWLADENFDANEQQRAGLAELIARARGAARAARATTADAIHVEEAHETTPELLAAVAALVGELSSSAAPPSAEEVRRIVASPACHLLVARDGEGRIVGMLTLVVFPIPTGVRAWIEDVVVTAAARGQGVGERLNREALRVARELGARTVDLTSRPSREAANRLYARLGFERRETNVYRHSGP